MLVQTSYPHHRKHYRLAFPESERPRLVLADGTRHTVIDCSEGGLRFRVTKGEVPAIGSPVAGELRFRGGRRVAVAGTAVRFMDGEVAVELAEGGISFAVLWAEARRLRRRAMPANAQLVI